MEYDNFGKTASGFKLMTTKSGEKSSEEISQRDMIMTIVDFLVKHLWCIPNGFAIAKYRSTAIVVIVNILDATEMPGKYIRLMTVPNNSSASV